MHGSSHRSSAQGLVFSSSSASNRRRTSRFRPRVPSSVPRCPSWPPADPPSPPRPGPAASRAPRASSAAPRAPRPCAPAPLPCFQAPHQILAFRAVGRQLALERLDAPLVLIAQLQSALLGLEHHAQHMLVRHRFFGPIPLSVTASRLQVARQCGMQLLDLRRLSANMIGEA